MPQLCVSVGEAGGLCIPLALVVLGIIVFFVIILVSVLQASRAMMRKRFQHRLEEEEGKRRTLNKAYSVQIDRLEGQVEELTESLKEAEAIGQSWLEQLERLVEARRADLVRLRAAYGLEDADALDTLERVLVYAQNHEEHPFWFDRSKRLIDWYKVLSTEDLTLGPESPPHEVRDQYERKAKPLRRIIKNPNEHLRSEVTKAKQNMAAYDRALMVIYGRPRELVYDVKSQMEVERENAARKAAYDKALKRWYSAEPAKTLDELRAAS